MSIFLSIFHVMEIIAINRQAVSTRQLAEAMDISPSSLSHHLKALTQAGLIDRTKRRHGTVMVTSDGSEMVGATGLLFRICRAGGWVVDKGNAAKQ